MSKIYFDDVLEQKLEQIEALRTETTYLCLWGMMENGITIKDLLTAIYANISPNSSIQEPLWQLIMTIDDEPLDHLKDSFLRASKCDQVSTPVNAETPNLQTFPDFSQISTNAEKGNLHGLEMLAGSK